MLLDIIKAILLISQSLRGTFLTQSSYKVLRIAADLFGKLNHVHSSKYNVTCLHGVGAIKWRTAKGKKTSIVGKRLNGCLLDYFSSYATLRIVPGV